MMRFLAVFILAAAMLGAVEQAQAYDRDIEIRQLAHAGANRSYGVYVPTTADAARPAPLIVALHGRYSSAKALHAISGLAAVAEARGAVLLYPETAGAFWNEGGHTALQRREAAADDAGFIEAAIAAVAGERAIDAARIYVVGHDVGGSMAFRLACSERRLAGVAVVSALMWDYAAQACPAAQQTSVLILHGRDDENFPVRGGAIPNSRTDARRLSATDTVAFWRERLGCAGRPSATSSNDSALYAACASGASLAYVGVARGAHEWFRDGENYELNRHRLDASAAIEDFFFNAAAFELPGTRADGRSRSWITYAPPNYDPARPAPLVIVLHGRPSTAASMAAISEMNAVAGRHGFIVVYPEGIDNEWNAYFDLRRSGNASLTGNRSILPQDDIGFLTTLAADLRVDLNIDPARMYVAGFSNGGFMTMRMACSASDTFAGFAEVGASLYVEMTDLCRRSPPSPVLFMHGSADPSIPYEGVTVGNPEGGEPIRITLRVIDTVSLFARRNECTLSGRSTTLAERGRSPGTSVVRFVPHECAGAPLEFYQINGGGHTWPGVPELLPAENFGPTNMDIHASEVIWDFFSRQTLAQRG
ncbi:MAG TPA: PHB depolymerase family esterase [Vitreimonas sp.]|uniref:alpha/beta hydrolase family esterase n=1 Tax=Vitreimonas sp. TaxID=3069702 RepID=UPI002D436C2A|nr:PHB depolymerase family esterase [Vitreimonas sp.]HYD89063.1 PHB depolymerase family esterase [Vitreimonas sp.]